MGQYWLVCNLSKNEFIDPHRLGCGLKLCEQVGSFPGTASGLLILCAAQREVRGGGDLDTEDNWHGPERESVGPGPMPKEYPTIAQDDWTLGRRQNRIGRRLCRELGPSSALQGQHNLQGVQGRGVA